VAMGNQTRELKKIKIVGNESSSDEETDKAPNQINE
jgi:hypothetical protein